MLKRVFDIAVSVSVLAVASPVIVTTAIVVKKKLGSPVIFKQTRPGLHGKPFDVYKFRSMTEDRDENGELLPNEMRMTKIGNFIRSTSLDELPQLINVLKGDLSLVGPRPLRMEYLELYNDHQRRRHEVKPGITGWAQVNGRNSITWEERFDLDVWYVENQNFLLDLYILYLTFIAVIKRKDVNASKNVTMERFTGTPKIS